ncbi:hypothetical protein XENOCAPTIV_020475, partial [Xenoophorus captivus]
LSLAFAVAYHHDYQFRACPSDYSGVLCASLYLWVTPEAHRCHQCLSIAVDYATVTSTDDKGCQVSVSTAEGSTQTSVTTKTVTCETFADDEEQHQPASLEELISQTSAAGDAMRHETGPPQLSDCDVLLAEVMSAMEMTPPPCVVQCVASA